DARSGGRRKKSGKQHTAVGQSVPGKEYFLFPAVAGFYHIRVYLSSGTFPDFPDQYVYYWHTGIFPVSPAKQECDQGAVFTKCAAKGSACRTDRCVGSSGPCYF